MGTGFIMKKLMQVRGMCQGTFNIFVESNSAAPRDGEEETRSVLPMLSPPALPAAGLLWISPGINASPVLALLSPADTLRNLLQEQAFGPVSQG